MHKICKIGFFLYVSLLANGNDPSVLSVGRAPVGDRALICLDLGGFIIFFLSL